MSLDLKLADDHDLALSSAGDARLLDGAERIAQQIKVTLLTFLGEWFLDTDFGVPYLEQVLIKAPQRAQLEAVFRARIADVPGVRGVRRLDLQIERALRRLRVEFEAETDEGIVTLQFVLLPRILRVPYGLRRYAGRRRPPASARHPARERCRLRGAPACGRLHRRGADAT